jgi:hypothetical protein
MEFPHMLDIFEKLRRGDLRSIGRADEVAEDMIKNPILFEAVLEGLFDGDPIIRMRSADALEKASSLRPEHIQPFKRQLIEEAPNIKQKEVRWHLAQIYPYLKLDEEERRKMASVLLSFVEEAHSRIVKVNSLQTLAELALEDANLRPVVVETLLQERKSGVPSVVSRTRRLLTQLEVYDLE